LDSILIIPTAFNTSNPTAPAKPLTLLYGNADFMTSTPSSCLLRNVLVDAGGAPFYLLSFPDSNKVIERLGSDLRIISLDNVHVRNFTCGSCSTILCSTLSPLPLALSTANE
jgi:hypothetical protein